MISNKPIDPFQPSDGQEQAADVELVVLPATIGDSPVAGNTGTAKADHAHAGVGSLHDGTTYLRGDVKLVAGDDIDITLADVARTATIALDDNIDVTSITADIGAIDALAANVINVDSIKALNQSPEGWIEIEDEVFFLDGLKVDTIGAQRDSPSGVILITDPVAFAGALYIDSIYPNTSSPTTGILLGYDTRIDGTLYVDKIHPNTVSPSPGIDLDFDTRITGDLNVTGALDVGGVLYVDKIHPNSVSPNTGINLDFDTYVNGDLWANTARAGSFNAGLDDNSQGQLIAYGDSNITQGVLKLYNGANMDATVNYWSIGGSTDGTLQIGTDGSLQIQFPHDEPAYFVYGVETGSLYVNSIYPMGASPDVDIRLEHTTHIDGDLTVEGSISGTGAIIIGQSACANDVITYGADTLCAARYTAHKTATISSLGIRLYTFTAGNKIELGIYTDSSGYPGTLLAQCTEYTLAAADQDGEIVLALQSAVSLTVGTRYWLVANVDTNTWYPYCWGDARVGCGIYKSSQTYTGTLPAKFPATASGNVDGMCMFGMT